MFKLLKGDVFKKKKKEPPSPPSNLVSYSPPLQASLTDTNSKEISSTTHNSLVVAPAVLEDSTVDVVEVVDRQEYVKTGVDVQVTSEESFGVNGGHEIKKTKVVLLLDGDGDAFHSDYLSQGYRGGSRAAVHTVEFVRKFIAERDSVKINAVDVLVMNFLNMAGFYQHRKSLGCEVDIRGFAQGFTSSPFATTMSDTGWKAQSADEAIKTQLRFHLSSCDYILLGGTHDGGYAKTLHRLEASSRNKILLALTHSNIIASALKELSLDQVVLPQNLFEKVESKGLIGRKFEARDAQGVLTIANGNSAILADATNQLTLAPIITLSSTPPSSYFPPSVIDPKFFPLLTLLREQEARGNYRPLRSQIGTSLAGRGVYNSFKEYVSEAEGLGIVRIGVNEGFMGSDWISLKRDLIPGTFNRPFPSNSSPPSPTKSLLSPQTEFLFLIKALRSLASAQQSRPLFGTVAEQLRRLDPNAYPEKGFKQFVLRAEELGIVDLGGVSGAEWICLSKKYS